MIPQPETARPVISPPPHTPNLWTLPRAAARNLALVRKIALNLIGRDRSSTASVRARRKRAAWNDDYMFQLLVGSSQPLA